MLSHFVEIANIANVISSRGSLGEPICRPLKRAVNGPSQARKGLAISEPLRPFDPVTNNFFSLKISSRFRNRNTYAKCRGVLITSDAR